MARKRRVYYRICFLDEVPKIGSGWRIVWLDTAGPKWVKIRDRYTGAPVRIPTKLWLQLDATPIKVKRAEFGRQAVAP